MNELDLLHRWQDPSLNALFGAGLGAAFYILLRTYRYQVDRTFDPRYNSAYVTRFFTGIVAGYILSVVVRFTVSNEFPESNSAIIALTPGVVALLGGFSAEVVEQILQRMTEILVTTLRGDGSAQARAEAATEKAKSEAKTIQTNAERASLLADLKEKHDRLKTLGIAPADVAQIHKQIEDLLKKLKDL